MRRARPANIALVAASTAFTIVVLVGVVFFAGIWRFGSSYTVSAYVYNARGIAPDSTVFEAGLPVGIVTGIRRHGPDAILTLRVDSGVRPLPVDSSIQLGLRSLAGEADVLLTPGHSTQLVRSGGSLGLARDQSYTEVDQILEQLSGLTEGRARQFFQGMGDGLAGKGANLNQTLGGAAGFVNNSRPVTSTLGVQHQQVADIIQNLGNVMSAIGQRGIAIREFAQGSTTTFTAIASRDAALRRMLLQLPSALSAVTDLGHALQNTTPTIAPVLDELGTTIHTLTPAIHELTPGAQRGITLLRALAGSSPPLRTILGDVIALKPSATRALSAVHAVTCQLNPMLRFLAPYGPDIANFFEEFGSGAVPYGQNSHELMLSALVDPTHFVRGVESQPVSSALSTLFNFGIFRKLGGVSGYDPLPGPGQDNNTTIGAGADGTFDYGRTHKYPHVTADCSR